MGLVYNSFVSLGGDSVIVRDDNTLYSKCIDCGKVFKTMEEYNEETYDSVDGWVWEVKHKEEYCSKLN